MNLMLLQIPKYSMPILIAKTIGLFCLLYACIFLLTSGKRKNEE